MVQLADVHLQGVAFLHVQVWLEDSVVQHLDWGDNLCYGAVSECFLLHHVEIIHIED